MYTIGELAKYLEIISIDTLRYYDEIGLLKPHHIDPVTRYRYYSQEQIDDILKIYELKGYGFSLEKIKEIMYDEENHIEAFEKKINELTQEANRLTNARNLLQKKKRKLKGESVSKLKNILLVDDSDFIRNVLGEILERSSYNVIEAKEGLSALKEYKNKKPDLVLLNITMPIMNGLEALAEIKKHDPEAAVIMLTATTRPKIVIECLLLGASDYVAKPFQGEYLLMTVDNYKNETKLNPATIVKLKDIISNTMEEISILTQDNINNLISICSLDFNDAIIEFNEWVKTV